LCLLLTYTLPEDLHPIGVRLALRDVVGAQRVSSLVSFKYGTFSGETQGGLGQLLHWHTMVQAYYHPGRWYMRTTRSVS
jgi:hypothetical protein